MSQPLRVQVDAEQITGLVLHPHDQRPTTGGVREARRLVGQLGRRREVLLLSRQQYSTGAPAPSLFLDVHLLPFGLARQPAGGEAVKHGVDHPTQRGTRIEKIGLGVKRQVHRPSQINLSFSVPLIYN